LRNLCAWLFLAFPRLQVITHPKIQQGLLAAKAPTQPITRFNASESTVKARVEIPCSLGMRIVARSYDSCSDNGIPWPEVGFQAWVIDGIFRPRRVRPCGYPPRLQLFPLRSMPDGTDDDPPATHTIENNVRSAADDQFADSQLGPGAAQAGMVSEGLNHGDDSRGRRSAADGLSLVTKTSAT
jgi:hypothetical protein